MGQITAAITDWTRSARLASLCLNLAVEDLRDRYRRTMLGLLWIVASFALFVLVKVLVFGQMTAVSTSEFGLYVALGFGLWSHINSMAIEACTAYTHARPWILGTSTPYPVYLLQVVVRNWLVFGLVLAVMAVALAWKPTPWTPTMLWALPGLAIYLLASVWLVALLAPPCARYRDLYHAVQTGMRLIFFVTPILWMPGQNATLAAMARWNPIAHFIAIVREPLMYDRVPYDSWQVVLGITLAGTAAAVATYASTRRRVAHWV
jgi:ABC-type polysaccharide/polyol phosphate export permease